MSETKRDYLHRLEAKAEALRMANLTPGSGMAMTYMEKHAQAIAVDGMGEAAANALTEPQRRDQFPTLAASVGIEAATLWDCAQLVMQRYEACAEVSYGIERARLAGKAAINAAATDADAEQAFGAIAWPA